MKLQPRSEPDLESLGLTKQVDNHRDGSLFLSSCLPSPLSQPLAEEVSHAQSQELPW